MDFAVKDDKIDTKGISNFYSLLEKFCEVTTDKEEKAKIERKLDLSNVPKIKLENYHPNYCLLSESKIKIYQKNNYTYLVVMY